MGGIVILQFCPALGALHGQILMNERCQHSCDNAAKQYEVAHGLDVRKRSGNVDAKQGSHNDTSDGKEPLCPSVL